jgi:hypothetical protein
MAGRQDFWEFFDDFFGNGAAISTSALYGSPWVVADVSTGGAPTYVIGTDGGAASQAPGIAKLDLAADSEAESLILSHGGIELFDVTDGLIYEARVKMNQAAVGAVTDFSFGLCAGQNATWDSTTVMAAFRVVGADSTTNVVVETDDGTTDKNDIATGQTLINAWKYFKIDMTDLTNVKFYMTNANSRLVRVAAGTTFDMSAYSSCVQPVFQLQKASGTDASGVSIDYVRVTGRRKT